MTYIQFIRVTHHEGYHRSFSAEAMQFWREHGAIVGEILRAECPMTFSEIVVACQESALEYPEVVPALPLDEAYLAWCLIRLLEYGMVTTTADVRSLP
jgi:hypothetical protein